MWQIPRPRGPDFGEGVHWALHLDQQFSFWPFGPDFGSYGALEQPKHVTVLAALPQERWSLRRISMPNGFCRHALGLGQRQADPCHDGDPRAKRTLF